MSKMEYKNKMLIIANNLCQNDVEQMKYIYSDIGKGILEKVTTSLKLIEVLEEHDYVAENKLDDLKKNLFNIGRTDLIAIIDGQDQASLNEIEGKFPGGCVFKLDLQTDNEELLRVEFKPKEAKSKWKVINNGCQESNSYYITKKEKKVLFVKVENIKVDGEVDFKFSFEDSKEKKQRSDCFEILITDICNYEMISCNQLSILIPDPCFSNEFPWINQNPPMPEYLDWRDKTNSQSRSSKEKPIQEFAEEYFERNFVDLNQVICFPPLMINEEMEDLTEKYKLCILQLFTELFKNKLTKGIRAVLFDYDLYHHATLLNCKPQEDIERCSANRVVIFYSKISVIFIVRVAASSDCIKQECKNCSADVKYFASINKPVIEEKTLTILGVVACCSVERKDLEKELTFQYSSKFDLYNTLFICQDELKTCETLNSWWRNKIFEYCSNKNSQSNNEALFKQVIGLTMLIIAKRDINLPTLKSDTLEQIRSLVLNPEQINAINDKELKKVIFGGFGSGKSVVGREIVKRFYLKSSKKSTLYYICCDHFSLLQCEMKEFADSLKKYSKSNVEILCENLLELWQRVCKNRKLDENKDISLPKLLQYYSENGSTEVHFVLDELPGEYVKEGDANELKKLFSSSLKQSLVVFIPKSIEKKRHLNINGKKQVLESNCFLEDKIGMKKIALEKSMRVTKCIQLLIDSAQDTISKSNTVLCQNSKIKSNHEKDNYLNSIMEIQNQQKTANNKQITKTMKTENSNFDAAQDITQQQEDDATIVKGYHDYDLDQGSKIVSNCQPVVGSNNYMETQFVFKYGVCGHSIIGEKPKVIFLPFLNWTDESSAKVLSVVLEKICFVKVRGTTVICSNMDEVQLVSYAIDVIENYEAVIYSPHLQKYTPTLKEKFSVTNKIKESKQNVLVTDSRGMCGAESEVVIVLVKPEEYFLRHVVADICARCTSYLIVFVLPSENAGYQKGGTIEEVLDNWSEDIVQKIQVKITNNENQLCRLTDCSLYINNKSKDFKDRGANMNFTNYNENKSFKVNDKHNILYEKLLSDLFNKSKSMEKGTNQSDIITIDCVHAESNIKFNWEQIKKVGCGTFGQVFLCQDLNTGKEYAMKQIETGYIKETTSDEAKRVQREINILKTLNHERIVKFFGTFQTDTLFCIFLEYMEGGSLHDKLLKDGALDENETSFYCYQILEGINYMHSKNIIHRNINGSIILLDSGGNCKLAGLSFSMHIQPKIGPKFLYGMPYWMSPEVIKGTAYDWKADIWSFGCTVLEMLTTKPPWSQYNQMDAMYKIVTQPTIPHLPDGSSAACKKFVNDCFKRDPSLRPMASELLSYMFVQR